MISRCRKVVSRLDSQNIISSAVVCGICFAESDTFVASRDCVGVFGEGTRLAMPKDNMCAEHLPIEEWFRGY